MFDDNISVTVQEEDLFSVCTTATNNFYINSLSDIGDIDLSGGVLDGSVLVYKTATNKWTSTHLLDQQIIDGGDY